MVGRLRENAIFIARACCRKAPSAGSCLTVVICKVRQATAHELSGSVKQYQGRYSVAFLSQIPVEKRVLHHVCWAHRRWNLRQTKYRHTVVGTCVIPGGFGGNRLFYDKINPSVLSMVGSMGDRHGPSQLLTPHFHLALAGIFMQVRWKKCHWN